MADEIVVVRHAQSIGNLASDESRNGNHSLFTHELRGQKSIDWPLTATGILQSQRVGEYIRKAIASEFDGYFCSPYPRARQTALHMGFTDVVWEKEHLLVERDWGGIENLPYPERPLLFAETGISTFENSIEWRPPGGESMLEILERTRDFLARLDKRVPRGKVLIVTHGGPVQAMRVLFHAVTKETYPSFISGDNYIRNCHVFHFSGKNGSTDFRYYQVERSMYPSGDEDWSESLATIG